MIHAARKEKHMRKQIFAAMVAALPLAAVPQGPAASGQGAGAGQQQGAGPRMTPERMEKRMRLARTLGLAEALDLDAPQALKLGETIAKFDDRRLASHKQMRDAQDVLRRAAQGEKATAAEVDQAIQKALDARAQLQAVDRELIGVVTKDLAPDKKARAVLFLAKFQRRFGGPGMGRGMGHGMERGPMRGGRGGMGGMMDGGRGMGGMGGGGMGPGSGDGQMGMGPPPPDGWDDGSED
jgi:hypothetical protein